MIICNPIFTTGADPWLIQAEDGTFYYTCTLGNRLAIWSSDRIENLHSASPTTVWTPPASGEGSCDLWAPELHYIDGKWLIYYAASDGTHDDGRRMHVICCSGDDPVHDSWMYLGMLNTARPGLDGTVFTHKGERYFIYAGYGDFPEHGSAIYIAKMKDLCTLCGDETCISQPEWTWECQGGMPINEGPAILHRNGRVFLFYSASTTWSEDYCLGVLTADEHSNLLNVKSWTKSQEPIFAKDLQNRVLAPGHNCFCTTNDGCDLIVYHAIEGESGHGSLDLSKRSPRIQSVSWNCDGTPNLGVPIACGKTLDL